MNIIQRWNVKVGCSVYAQLRSVQRCQQSRSQLQFTEHVRRRSASLIQDLPTAQTMSLLRRDHES